MECDDAELSGRLTVKGVHLGINLCEKTTISLYTDFLFDASGRHSGNDALFRTKILPPLHPPIFADIRSSIHDDSRGENGGKRGASNSV